MKKILGIYAKDFQKIFFHEITDTSVFMIITNKSYGEFTVLFLDNRGSLNLNNNDEFQRK